MKENNLTKLFEGLLQLDNAGEALASVIQGYSILITEGNITVHVH